MQTIASLKKRSAVPLLLILTTLLMGLLFWRSPRTVRAQNITYRVVRTPGEAGVFERILNEQARSGLKFVTQVKIGPSDDPRDFVLVFSSQ